MISEAKTPPARTSASCFCPLRSMFRKMSTYADQLQTRNQWHTAGLVGRLFALYQRRLDACLTLRH